MIDLGDVREKFREDKIKRVKLGAIDMDGVLRGKWISPEKFNAVAESTIGFCDVILGWDIGDVLYDNVKYTGWHTGYPDAVARVDLQSYRHVPWEPGTAFFLLDFLGKNEQPLEISPRQVLQRVLRRAEEMGYSPSFCRRVRILRVSRERADAAREALSRPGAAHAGHVRLQRAARVGEFGDCWWRCSRNRRHSIFHWKACIRRPGPAFTRRRLRLTRDCARRIARRCSRLRSRRSPAGTA